MICRVVLVDIVDRPAGGRCRPIHAVIIPDIIEHIQTNRLLKSLRRRSISRVVSCHSRILRIPIPEGGSVEKTDLYQPVRSANRDRQAPAVRNGRRLEEFGWVSAIARSVRHPSADMQERTGKSLRSAWLAMAARVGIPVPRSRMASTDAWDLSAEMPAVASPFPCA